MPLNLYSSFSCHQVVADYWDTQYSWEVSTVPHSIQRDSSSCGVLVMKVQLAIYKTQVFSQHLYLYIYVTYLHTIQLKVMHDIADYQLANFNLQLYCRVIYTVEQKSLRISWMFAESIGYSYLPNCKTDQSYVYLYIAFHWLILKNVPIN